MTQAIEHEVLHEIAMSIGTSLDMQSMLKTSLSVLVRRLGCTVGSILLREDENAAFQAKFTLPLRANDNHQLVTAIKCAIEAISLDSTLPIPLTNDTPGLIHYGWQIDRLGLLILGRSTPLSYRLLRELDPLIEKLGYAITASRQFQTLHFTQEELKRERTLLQNLIANLHSGILVEDTEGQAQHINEHFIEIFGLQHTIGDLMAEQGSHLSRIKYLFASPDRFIAKTQHEVTHNAASLNKEFILEDGRILERDYLPIEISKDKHGHLWQYRDITDRKQTEQQLKESQIKMEHLAHHDALTNLPNRFQLDYLIKESISQATRNENLVGVCFLDLDRFKRINDNFGHEIGDRVLIETGRRLCNTVRSSDSVARLGGDEFVVLLCGFAKIEELNNSLDRILNVISKPYELGDIKLSLTVSIGVTLYPFDNSDSDALLRHADQAMYRVKQTGRNRHYLFDVNQDREEGKHHRKLEQLWQALNNNEFVLYYQPKVNMRTGQVIGAEALIRWQHPQLGLLSPIEFLPQIESNHELTIAVGEWVITSALKQLEDWSASGFDPTISINIAAHHLQVEDFVERISTILSDFPRNFAHKLELEILETAAIENPSSMRLVLEKCAQLGLNSALDDFGTGYSSLTYLKHLPVNTVKIDKSFVRDMLDDPDDLAIIDGVISLAAAFHNEVVAEGVENAEQGVMLMQLGCDIAQGYFIAKPMLACELPKWATDYQLPDNWAQAGRSATIRGNSSCLENISS